MKWLGSGSVLAAVLGLALAASAAETARHSGFISAIAADARSFVLDELGPLRPGRDVASALTRRTITLTPSTEFVVVARVDEAPSGYRGDFVEVPVGPERVYLNDYVTVECRHEGKRLVAVKITVVEMPTAGGSK